MVDLPAEETSSRAQATYPELKNDTVTDVVIVGGGITGINTAYLLKNSGLKVIVLEKHNIASGTTGGTTGKVTSQHGLKYADLQKRLGEPTARLYGQANEAAIKKIEQVIKKEKISCQWSRADNYVYTTKPDKVASFREEARTAAKLGLPASFETKLDLPFKVTGAIKFTNQAKFQAKNYVAGLAKVINSQGSYVYENSEVIDFHDGETAWVETRKAKITAKHIVVATKVPAAPLAARIGYCFDEFPTTSYIVASQTKTNLKAMYISPDKDNYSILPLADFLLIGGANRLPIMANHKAQYKKLGEYGAQHFDLKKIDYMWRALDYLPYDGVPLIGKVYPRSKHIYTATAFQKWGLSTSMVAATILHDLILGEPNVWADIFRTNRLKTVLSAPRAIKLLAN
jgi:glycine/D-amino acid oxidase-like deaminating enzyme